MLDHQNSVSIDMRQLSWEFFFINSNPGKIKTTKKDQYPRVNFLMLNKGSEQERPLDFSAIFESVQK